MPPTSKTVISALLMLLLAGCGGKVVSKPLHDSRQATLTVEWEKDAGAMSPLLRLALTNDNTRLCAIANNGEARLFSVEDSERERLPVYFHNDNDDYTAGIACHGDVVAAVSGNGWLRVYDASAGTLWHKDLKTRVFGAPLIANGKLFVLGLDGRILAYTLRQGRELWRYVSPLENLVRTPLDSALTLDGNLLYAGIDNGVIVALDQASGRVKWENTIAIPGGNNEISNILDVSTPVTRDGITCASAYGGGVACFDSASGKRLWHYSLDAYTRVAIDDAGKRLFVTDVGGALYALSMDDGRLLWRAKTGSKLSAPAYLNGMALVGDIKGDVHAYFADTGNLGTTLELRTGSVLQLLPLPDTSGDLAVLSLSGWVFRLKLDL